MAPSMISWPSIVEPRYWPGAEGRLIAARWGAAQSAGPVPSTMGFQQLEALFGSTMGDSLWSPYAKHNTWESILGRLFMETSINKDSVGGGLQAAIENQMGPGLRVGCYAGGRGGHILLSIKEQLST